MPKSTADESVREKPGKYDLEERTARFGERVISFAKRIPGSPVTVELIRQMVRAGTSIGANYYEANNGESKRDFRHKVAISRKESQETKYWLRMIASAVPECRDEAAELWQEAKELNLIFSKIVRSCDGK